MPRLVVNERLKLAEVQMSEQRTAEEENIHSTYCLTYGWFFISKFAFLVAESAGGSA